MKKNLSFLFCILIVLISLFSFSSCEKYEKIELTSDNYGDYIALNVKITDFYHEGEKYYATITIETDRAANVEFESVKLTRKIANTGSSAADILAELRNEHDAYELNLNHLGVSSISFIYSSRLDFSGSSAYQSIIDDYAKNWNVEGFVLIPK